MSLKPEYFCSNCLISQPKATSTLKTCQKCRLVKYCDLTCQKEDLRLHKADCRIFREHVTDYLAKGIPYLDYPYMLQDFYMEQARKSYNYFTFERVVEIFNADHYTSHEQFGGTFWYILAECYLNLGLHDKALEAFGNGHSEQIDEDGITNEGLKFAVEFALKLNEIAKIRQNPTQKALQNYQTFLGILTESSQETHLHILNSSPVMEKVQKYTNLSCVEDLQDEIVSWMIDEFWEKRIVYIALKLICNGQADMDVDDIRARVGRFKIEAFNCKFICRVGEHYFPRHPEFYQVYQKYKKAVEAKYKKALRRN